ncbi:MAG: amino acid adenylation domain-containing protein, partial [bacterium]|nr:amino acid adenylation domain-containing protein [bacterium]
MLRELISKPEENVTAIDIISDEEKKQISEFNETTVKYHQNKTIHQLFRQQAEKTPQKNAAIGMSGARPAKLTYNELNKQTDDLAAVLREKGVNTDTIVGLMVPRSIEMLLCILGIWKAGGAYLPLDPAYPQDRIDYILKDSASGADTLSPELVEKFNETLYNKHKTRLINAYGPTEAAVDMTHYDCTGEEARGRIPIGKPIAN